MVKADAGVVGSSSSTTVPINIKDLKPLGSSHYRLKLPFSLSKESFKKHYTISLSTVKEGVNSVYFAGPSKTFDVNEKITLAKADLAQDYASGIHFYDLFRTPEFKRDFEADSQNQKLGYLGGGVFQVWAPFASERTMAGKIVIDATQYFTEVYKVDGFRFDLMGVLPITVMNEVQANVITFNSKAIIYGEGWDGMTRLNNGITDQQNYPPQIINAGSPEYTAPSIGELAVAERIQGLKDVAVFSDKFRNNVLGKVAPSDKSDLGFVETASYDQYRMYNLRYAMSGGSIIGGLPEYQPVVNNPQQYINFLDVHDDYTLSDHLSTPKRYTGNVGASEFTTDTQKVDRQKMALAMLFLSQGTPILQAGSEFDRTKKGDDVSEFYYDKKLTLDDVTLNYAGLSDSNSKASQLRKFTQALVSLR